MCASAAGRAICDTPAAAAGTSQSPISIWMFNLMFVLFVLVRAASCVVVNSGGVVQVILDLN